MKELIQPAPPNPNLAPQAYSPQYHNQAGNQLKLYLNQTGNNQSEIIKSVNSLNVMAWLGNC